MLGSRTRERRVSPTDLVRRLARAIAAALEAAPSKSRGRLRPASDDDREPDAKSDDDGLNIESCDNSNMGVSSGWYGAPISLEMDWLCGSFARCLLDPLGPGPPSREVLELEGGGGWTTREVCNVDQDVAIV